MTKHDYVVKLPTEGHANLFCDGQLVLGSEVIDLDYEPHSKGPQEQRVATVLLANGERIERVSVVEV
ncbi:hypothetical protein [Vibrio hangzhouensis]|uniref:hypothetical protein n=1 Tax=Vibrio hangzhouensis TaxID=462991 RepID=UPI001C9636BB|nr:hypothetical protein [Vibrio hangzhouensis]MBY6199276.1 hypothetical protein [Vibrio hangzhouensis]